MAKQLLIITAISGLLAVALGAFGAHGLKTRVSPDLLSVYQTGVEYHFYHTFALGLVALLLLKFPAASGLAWSGWCFLAGILVFSGSLYLMTFTGWRWLGAITPVGGLSFMAGWVLLAIASAKNIG